MNDPTTEVAAAVATQLIKDSLSAIYTPISSILTVKRAQFLERFSQYCTLVHGKSSLVRTLYSKNKPMRLHDVYVKTMFQQGRDKFSDTDLINKFAAGNRIIIKGNGGSGKTIFLKHLWLSRFEKPEGRIPIFVELRRLNDLSHIDLATFCRNELQSDMSFGKGVFHKLCEAGKFEFIFDGFDEVARENRKHVEREIISLSDRYKECCFLVSGREDDRFSSWGDFETYTVSPLSFDEVRNLIDKIPFDKKVKRKFLETLKLDFYDQHQSFLSSPLLACMMLMTFNENAIIPSKLTEFYKSAFQTLLTWHDATKDSFERDRALTVDEFRKVFSTFCLMSYYDQSFEFDDEQFRRYVSKALRYHGIDAPVDDVINDVCESANLLQKDGLKYLFVHRSFQEYFAAECAMHVVSGKASSFLKAFAKRVRDTVFSMCYEIHPELVYDQYLSERFDWLERSGFLSKDPDGQLHRNIWICSSVTLEMTSLKGKGLHAVDLSYQTDQAQDDAISLIFLCNEIRNQRSSQPAFMAMEAVLEAANDLTMRGAYQKFDTSALRIVVSFADRTYKLSIRNTGKTVIPAKEMKLFRAQFSAVLSDKIKSKRKEAEAYYKNATDLIEAFKSERLAKEESIDDILGTKDQ